MSDKIDSTQIEKIRRNAQWPWQLLVLTIATYAAYAAVLIIWPNQLNPVSTLLFYSLQVLLTVLLTYRFSADSIENKTDVVKKSIARSSVRKLFALEDNLLIILDIISNKSHESISAPDLKEISNYLILIQNELGTFKGDFKDIIGEDLKKESEGRANIYELYKQIEKLDKALSEKHLKGMKDEEEKSKMRDELIKLKTEFNKQKAALPITGVSGYPGRTFSSALSAISLEASSAASAIQKAFSGIADPIPAIKTDNKK